MKLATGRRSGSSGCSTVAHLAMSAATMDGSETGIQRSVFGMSVN